VRKEFFHDRKHEISKEEQGNPSTCRLSRGAQPFSCLDVSLVMTDMSFYRRRSQKIKPCKAGVWGRAVRGVVLVFWGFVFCFFCFFFF